MPHVSKVEDDDGHKDSVYHFVFLGFVEETSRPSMCNPPAMQVLIFKIMCIYTPYVDAFFPVVPFKTILDVTHVLWLCRAGKT